MGRIEGAARSFSLCARAGAPRADSAWPAPSWVWATPQSSANGSDAFRCTGVSRRWGWFAAAWVQNWRRGSLRRVAGASSLRKERAGRRQQPTAQRPRARQGGQRTGGRGNCKRLMRWRFRRDSLLRQQHHDNLLPLAARVPPRVILRTLSPPPPQILLLILPSVALPSSRLGRLMPGMCGGRGENARGPSQRREAAPSQGSPAQIAWRLVCS